VCGTLIAEACSVARSLQPSVVVVEAVDLIAEERGPLMGQHPLLFELLNEMDGLGQDIDVTFLLTTNRADLLEEALAACDDLRHVSAAVGGLGVACRYPGAAAPPGREAQATGRHPGCGRRAAR